MKENEQDEEPSHCVCKIVPVPSSVGEIAFVPMIGGNYGIKFLSYGVSRLRGPRKFKNLSASGLISYIRA